MARKQDKEKTVGWYMDISEELSYYPHTGELRWRKMSRGRNPHLRADVNDGKYRKVTFTIYGRVINIRAHRVAWRLQTGEWPEHDIDHINRDPQDNRWDNLRKATRSQNLANRGPSPNNTSGKKGVCWDKSRKKWLATISDGNKSIYIGRYDTIEEAAAAYDRKAKELYGEYARTNGDGVNAD